MNEGFPKNEQPREKRSSTITGGLVLIILGAFFLAENFGLFDVFDQVLGQFTFNWWAFFILIPIVAISVKLVESFRANDGQLNKDAQGQVGGLLILSLVFVALLLNWNWGVIWPLFLVAIGLNILLPMLLKKD